MEASSWTRVSGLLLVTGAIVLIVGSALTYFYWDNRSGTSHKSELASPRKGRFSGLMLVAAGLILVTSGTCLRFVLWSRRIQYGLANQTSRLDQHFYKTSRLREHFYKTSILDEKHYKTSILDDKTYATNSLENKYDLNNKLEEKYPPDFGLEDMSDDGTAGLDADCYHNGILDVKYNGDISSSEGHLADPTRTSPPADPTVPGELGDPVHVETGVRRSSLMMQLTGILPGSLDMGSRLPITVPRDDSNLYLKSSDERDADMQVQAIFPSKKRRDTLAVILTDSLHSKDPHLPPRRMSLHDQCSLLKTQSAQCVNAVKQKLKFNKASSTLQEEENEQMKVSILGHIYQRQEEYTGRSNEQIEKKNLQAHAPMLKDIGPSNQHKISRYREEEEKSMHG